MARSFNGMGTRYYGHADKQPDGSYIATEWIIFLYIPLIPIRSFRLRPTGETTEGFGTNRTFDASRVPLYGAHLVKVYLGLAIAIASIFVLDRLTNTPSAKDQPASTLSSAPVVNSANASVSFAPLGDIDESVDYWFYVDKALVQHKTTAKAFTARVPGGHHVLEIASRAPSSFENDLLFPFEFISKEVDVQSGESIEFSFDASRKYRGRVGDLAEARENSWQEWIDALTARYDRESSAYQRDPVVAAMRSVRDSLQDHPPAGPAIDIHLPEDYGGAREFDADQVREIDAWLKRIYWDGWFPPKEFRGRRVPEDIPAQARPAYDQLKLLVEEERGSIDKLEEIARRLDEVSR